MSDSAGRLMWIGVGLLLAGSAGWLFVGGVLFGVFVLAGAGLLFWSSVAHGGNDRYGLGSNRSAYQQADDLKRADDDTSTPPHPGPLPPQPPGW